MFHVRQKLPTLFTLLIMIGAIPPLMVALSPIKTFAAGCILTALLAGIFSLRNIKHVKTIKNGSLLAISIIALYALIQHIAIGAWQVKSYASVAALSIVVFSAYLLSKELLKLNDKLLLTAFKWSYYFFLFVGILNIATGYTIGKSLGYTHGKPIFPFLEPSHYALFLGPLSYIYISTQKKTKEKLISVAAIVAMGLLIPNTTLLVYSCLSIITITAAFKPKTLLIALPIVLAVMGYGAEFVLSNEYFSSRLDLSSDKQGATTLVYLQGVQDSINSLSLTNGLGLGFQMLGTQPPSEYSYSIAKVMSDVNGELNREDGGFLAAKIISEFGFLGLGAVIYFIFTCAISFLAIRRLSKNNHQPEYIKQLIFHCIIVSFSIEMFIRGYGYFSSGFYLFLVAVFCMANLKKTHQTKLGRAKSNQYAARKTPSFNKDLSQSNSR